MTAVLEKQMWYRLVWRCDGLLFLNGSKAGAERQQTPRRRLKIVMDPGFVTCKMLEKMRRECDTSDI